MPVGIPNDPRRGSKEIKDEFKRLYHIDPDKKENERGYLEFESWFLSRKKFRKLFGKFS